MKLTTFLHKTNLERSLLIGYYGGGNYGDELLLEVLGNLLTRDGVKQVTIAYQEPASYPTMHHDFGYQIIDIHSKPQLFKAALKNKTILVGGGGLWGVDMNLNTFIMSIFLFACRWLLGKKVYLLGIGYYSSTTRLGRLGAWLAGKSANLILARDAETYANFGGISKHVHLDSDISWYIDGLDLRAYDHDVVQMEKKLKLGSKTLFFAPRRSQAKRQRSDFARFNDLVGECITANQDKRIVLALAESAAKAPELHEWGRELKARHKQLSLLDFAHNPLTLFLFFRKHHDQLALIAPQLHLIITAYLTDTLFVPTVYDNKVSALLTRIGVPQSSQLPLGNLTGAGLQRFIDDYYGGDA
ncbi:MAG TPA: polysaccharide pyruvyl transferase family protein [Bacillota bacterium]|nr:polysaccharide pyruvyl transferase family protein [Bacillota bacterium]